MFKEISVINPLTQKVYVGFSCETLPTNIFFFKKSVMKEIINDCNIINKAYNCNIEFKYNKETDSVICKDKEFKNSISNYISHMLYTNYGLMKLYNFGNEINWEEIR